MAAVEIVHQLLGGIKVMTTAHVLQAPVRIIRIIAEHDNHSVGIILGDDLHNGIPFQVQPFPQVPGQILIYHGVHLLPKASDYCPFCHAVLRCMPVGTPMGI